MRKHWQIPGGPGYVDRVTWAAVTAPVETTTQTAGRLIRSAWVTKASTDLAIRSATHGHPK
jgi:hypothetical protein